MLFVRFRVNDKHFDMTVVWDGRGDVLDQIESMARGVLMQIDQPPPPTFAQLQAQVGKLGHVDVEPLPSRVIRSRRRRLSRYTQSRVTMAALDFPNAPTTGQYFVAGNGVTSQWNGTWLPVGGSTALYIGDTPPALPATGQLWFKSDEARLYVYYNDGNRPSGFRLRRYREHKRYRRWRFCRHAACRSARCRRRRRLSPTTIQSLRIIRMLSYRWRSRQSARRAS